MRYINLTKVTTPLFILALVVPSLSFAIGPIMMEPRPIIIEEDTTTTTVTTTPHHHHKFHKPHPKPQSKPHSKPKPPPHKPAMGEALNKQMIRNFYNEIWVKNNQEALYTYLDKDVNGYINGRHYYITDFAKRAQRFAAASKDVTVEFKELLAEKNKVAVYVTICGTDLKLDKKICAPNVGIYTIMQHKITEFVINTVVPKAEIKAQIQVQSIQ